MLNSKLISKTVFLVISCDAYSDLWPMYINLFERYWADCPFDKYFATNYKSIESNTFFEFKMGQDNHWSDGLIHVLEFLSTKYEYVLITHEDLPLVEIVDNLAFISILSEFEKLEGNYLKFLSKPHPTNYYNKYFGEIKPGSTYRTTTVYALWDLKLLRSLLVCGESAWEFEKKGPSRSDKYNKFYVVYNDFFKVINTVIKGKWNPIELKKLNKIGYYPVIERNIFSKQDKFTNYVHKIIYKIFICLIPWSHRRRVSNYKQLFTRK